MSLQDLLAQVPFIRHLGVQVEDFSPGRVVLSLSAEPDAATHMGSMHAGALFALAEIAGSAALSTHQQLVGMRVWARAGEIRFRRPATGRVTAHAEITDEMVQAVLRELARAESAEIVVPVEVLDGRGSTVARVTGSYRLRGAAGE